METHSFETAMRLLIDDAASNFARFRGANRTPDERVITEFDIAFAVEGAYDTFVCLLDYDIPSVHIALYEGPDAAVADLMFDAYQKRLEKFAVDEADHSKLTQGDDDRAAEWRRCAYPTSRGPWVTATRVSEARPGAASRTYAVRIEIRGAEVECIHGSPEDSILHILFADTPLQARTKKSADRGIRKSRDHRRKR